MRPGPPPHDRDSHVAQRPEGSSLGEGQGQPPSWYKGVDCHEEDLGLWSSKQFDHSELSFSICKMERVMTAFLCKENCWK